MADSVSSTQTSDAVQRLLEEQRRREAAEANGTTQSAVVQDGPTTVVREVPVAVEGTPTKELDPDGGQPSSQPRAGLTPRDTDVAPASESVPQEDPHAAFRTTAEQEVNAARVEEQKEPTPKSSDIPALYTTADEGNFSPAAVPSGEIDAARQRDVRERGAATREAAQDERPVTRVLNDGTPDGQTAMDTAFGTIPEANDVIHGRHIGDAARERGPLDEDGSKSPHDKTSGGSRQQLAIQQEKVRLENQTDPTPRRADGTPIPQRTI